MNKKIEIDIKDIDNLIETYNINKVEHKLLNYIIEEASAYKNKEITNITINNLTEIKAANLIKEGLKLEYEKSMKKHKHINFLQAMYLLIGIILITLSLVVDINVIDEIILIGGWVFVWSTIELEITADLNEIRRRKTIKKLLRCEIIEKNGKIKE